MNFRQIRHISENLSKRLFGAFTGIFRECSRMQQEIDRYR